MTQEEPYSNREIREFFKDVKTQLDRIEAQTVKTNGRVSKLEAWKEFSKGGIKVITVILVPILAFLAIEVINLMSKVK